MGLYKNTNGVLTPIAGRGKAEYGASTVRTGTVTNSVAIPSGGMITENVVFDTPMPDANYEVSLSNKNDADFIVYTSVRDKTANGFGIMMLRMGNDPVTIGGAGIDYTAFKLYTDKEYDDVLDTVNSLQVKSGRLTITEVVTSGFCDYYLYGKLLLLNFQIQPNKNLIGWTAVATGNATLPITVSQQSMYGVFTVYGYSNMEDSGMLNFIASPNSITLQFATNTNITGLSCRGQASMLLI